MGPGDSGGQDQGRKLTAELAARAGCRFEPPVVESLSHPAAEKDDEAAE